MPVLNLMKIYEVIIWELLTLTIKEDRFFIIFPSLMKDFFSNPTGSKFITISLCVYVCVHVSCLPIYMTSLNQFICFSADYSLAEYTYEAFKYCIMQVKFVAYLPNCNPHLLCFGWSDFLHCQQIHCSRVITLSFVSSKQSTCMISFITNANEKVIYHILDY